MNNTRPIIQFSLLFAITVVVFRLLILSRSSIPLSVEYLQSLFIGAVSEFTFGFLLAIGIFSKQKYLSYFVTIILIPSVVAVLLVCFHYESVFHRLPGADLLFYFTQLSHLSSSLNEDFPVLIVFIEFIVFTGLLVIGIWKLKENSSDNSVSVKYQAGALIVLLCSIIIQAYPGLLSEKYFWGSRQAVVWLMQSHFVREKYQLEDLQLTNESFREFRRFHGHINSRPILNPDYPICTGISVEENNIGLKRNVILLVLEGIGNDEMSSSSNENPLMPNLQRIAEENLYLGNIIAPGTKSIQTLPAVFSGLPANPHINYMWRKLSLDFDGLPNKLKSENYRTVYMHGGDLSFEFQRNYLQQVGFDELIEYDSDKPYEVYGWGYSDDVMFEELKNWIEDHNGGKADQHYFATLFTLSTHHPYLLPENWSSNLDSNNTVNKDILGWHHYENIDEMIIPFAETQRFLDYHLGAFYEWYKKNENDTLLLITGDHGFNLFESNEIQNERFDVPLIISGLSNDEKKRLEPFINRVGGLHDLPATILGRLGIAKNECDLGVDLFSPEHEWSDDRYVYATAGDAFERLHIWNSNSEILLDRLRDSISIREHMTFGPFGEIDEKGKNKTIEFLNNMLPVHYYLFRKNAYFWPVDTMKIRDALPDVVEPIFVSHRGNINGQRPPHLENTRFAIESVIESGYEWVEVDIQMTKDGKFIAMHDASINDNGTELVVNQLTLEELSEKLGGEKLLTLDELISEYSDDLNMLIEVKASEYIYAYEFMHLVREVANTIKSRQSNNKIIVDSFNQLVVASIKNQCDCEVGFDTQFKAEVSKAELEEIADMGVDWVYVEESIIDPVFIKEAHDAGLKVMAYTVNTKDTVNRWRNENILPDGVITDDLQISH